MDMMETSPRPATLGCDDIERVARLNAPLIDRRHVPLANRLSVRRHPIAFGIGDAVLSFSALGLGSIDALVKAVDQVVIGLRIDGCPAALRLSVGLFERVMERIEPELLAADVNDDFLPLLLEASLADALTMAETTYRGRIELLTIGRGSAVDDHGLDILFEIAINGDAAGRASLRVGDAVAGRLADIVAERPKARSPLRDLKTEICFRAGAMWLDLGELRSLKVGDVLVAELGPRQSLEIAGTLGERWLLRAERRAAGLTLTKPLRLASAKDRDLWMMVDTKQPLDSHDDDDLSDPLEEHQDVPAAGASARMEAPDPGPAPERQNEALARPDEEDASFDELPIKLVFELGRVEISLGLLQELGPGHVFELDRPVGEAVEVFAGGRRVGQGEIVNIDEQVGVRMVRLFGHG